ncbi:TnpA family transposase [Mesorhizobium sangaii]|uniref:TnpA family transposase n=1 Tax=Mesorhizobium sangaii TaxID=505389 RepID=A0A841PZ52_9HYPH|nr:TnpA family transposase [Mesorhizobium sangaii]
MIAGTAGEAIHALDGMLGHESSANLSALHVDGGGVSDIVFAVMHLLGLDFEPRIPRLSDRRLYAFETPKRYGGLAPLFGHRLNRDLIVNHWPDIQRVIGAMRDRTVTPSLILKKLSAYRQQNSLAAALRKVGRIERTLFTLRWFQDPALCQLVTGELNKEKPATAWPARLLSIGWDASGIVASKISRCERRPSISLPPRSFCSIAAISTAQ